MTISPSIARNGTPHSHQIWVPFEPFMLIQIEQYFKSGRGTIVY